MASAPARGLIYDVRRMKDLRQPTTEAALRLLQFAVDHAAEAMFTVGPDSRILAVNQTACRRLEYSREELLRLRIPDIDPAMTLARWPEHWAELRARGQMV